MSNLESVAKDISTSQENLLKIEKLRFRSKNLVDSNSCSLSKKKLDSLVIAQKNLLTVIQKLDDFLNAEKKLDDLKILVSDPANFILVQEKLERLLELQRPFASEQNSKFSFKLSETKDFEEKFYESVYKVFEDYLVLSIENPLVLQNAIKIVVSKALKDSKALRSSSILLDSSKIPVINRPSDMEEETLKNLLSSSDSVSKMFRHLQAGTAKRFEQNLGGKQELQDILENIKFSIDDLLIIFEKMVPLFPKELQVFSVIEQQYKKNIDKKIVPVITDMGELQENPGTFITQRLHHLPDKLVPQIRAPSAKSGVFFFGFFLPASEDQRQIASFLRKCEKCLFDFSAKCDQKRPSNDGGFGFGRRFHVFGHSSP